MTAQPRLFRTIEVTLSVDCPHCGRPIPIAGPVLHTTCAACQQPVGISPAAWTALMVELDERSFAAETNPDEPMTWTRIHDDRRFFVRWRLTPVRCRRCRAELPLGDPEDASPRVCTACQTALAALAAPPWLHAQVPTVTRLFGAELSFDAAALDPEARRFWIELRGTPRQVAVHSLAADRQAFVPPQVKTSAFSSPWLVLLVVILLGIAGFFAMSGMGERFPSERL